MILTTEEKLNNLIVHAYHRELEVYNYQINIDNYTNMLLALPSDEWPESMLQYKDMDILNIPHSVSDEDIQIISDYQYRDRLRSILRTERVEQNKASRVLDSLKLQIGQDYTTLVASYKASIIA